MCSYILHNLPDWHTCPECGFKYDPYTKSHRIYEQGKHLGQIAWLVLLGFAALELYLRLRTFRFAEDWRPDAIGVACILLGVRPAYRLVRSLHRPCRVIINHEGIRFNRPGAREFFLSWENFGEAYVSAITGVLLVRGATGRSLLRLRYRSIGTRRIRRKLAWEMNVLAEIYRSTDNPVADPRSGTRCESVS